MNKSLVKIIKLLLPGLVCLLVLLLFRRALEHVNNLKYLMQDAKGDTDFDIVAVDGWTKKRAANFEYEGTAAAVMENRRMKSLRACQDLRYNTSNARLPRALVAVSRAVVYCPVEKTASTFFRRYLYQLDHTIPVRSPFEVPVKLIYGCPNIFMDIRSYASQLVSRQQRIKKLLNTSKKRTQLLQKLERIQTIDKFLKNSTKFMFVRDPYSRLFSAYTDKLLAPNPDHWNSWGKPAIQKYRENPSKLSLRCGHDVTFQEFLSFVLNLNSMVESIDPHLRPIVELCRPCSFNYTVIGHMDTLERDVVYLSSLVNVTHSQLELDKMAADSARDAIQDSVMDAFTIWLARIVKCLTKLQAGKRIWIKLQQRGIISNRLDFPFDSDPDSLEDMDANDFIQTIIDALKESTDIEELYLQKKEAVSNAYKSVSLETLNKIAKMYAADFKIFDFDAKPAYIFDRTL